MPLHRCERPLGHVLAQVTAHGHAAGLGRMLVLPVTTARRHSHPAIALQETDYLAYLHQCKLPDSRTVAPTGESYVSTAIRWSRNPPPQRLAPSRPFRGHPHDLPCADLRHPHTRSWAANHFNERVRLKEENERLRNEILLLREESRIKDARMEQIPPHRRPHYPPVERLAILELRAARGWSLTQTAARFLVTPLTISSWTNRLDEEGPDALVRIPEPVNRFPEFVGYLVRRLKVLCPSMAV